MAPEVNSGQFQYFSDIWLDEYGYYVHAREGDTENKTVFRLADFKECG